MNEHPCISVIVPCFNEEAVLPLLFERLAGAANSSNLAWEVVAIDDGSRDGTWRLLQEQARTDPRWRCFALSRNFGHQAALSAGLKFCRGDAAIIIDADLQDPPEELIRFIDAWRAGNDVVHGVRTTRTDSLTRRFVAWAYYRLMRRLVPFEVPADAGDFALLDRKVIDVINQLPERARYLRGLRAWCGFRQTSVAFHRAARAAGRSHYTVAKLFRLAADGALAFSVISLRFAIHLGGALMLASVAFAVVAGLALGTGAAWLRGEQATLVIVVDVVAFLAGVQLLCLGIVGEYVGRILTEVQRRPLWIIREACDPAAENRANGASSAAGSTPAAADAEFPFPS